MEMKENYEENESKFKYVKTRHENCHDKEDIFHDPLGCSECHVRGDWEFCKCSRYHPQHDLHECPEGQVCFCLNPKYSYDHFD